MEAYCVKCRTKREIRDPQPFFGVKGGAFTRGTCATCGSSVTRLGATEAHKGIDRPKPTVGVGGAGQTEAAKPGGKRSSAKGPGKTSTRARRAGPEDERRDPAESSSRFAAKPASGSLVIVESPAKAKTIGRFLGREFRVRASVGHIRDLPQKQMGVDIEHGFIPHYVITPKKKDVVKQLRELARGAREIYLATDPDREGEAISWHLVQTLGKDIGDKPVRRVEFHEITRDAVDRAFARPRDIDMNLVDAQQARRLLDRIVGYTLSPLLRKKMTRNGLSAGRVQSVAVRLVVEREREIQAFVPVEYWSIEAELAKQKARSERQEKIPASQPDDPAGEKFRARLIQIAGNDFVCHTGEQAIKLKEILENCTYRVLDVRRKDVFRNPAPPFITSTLQQEASRKLGFNAKRTMAAAQQLYEGISVGDEGSVGLITYMRTDSTNVAESARKEAWSYIKEKFGEGYLPKTPRIYAKKVAGAQEAHEAIRPTKTFRDPRSIQSYLSSDQFRLYDLIWKRFVASQMESAIFDTTAVDIEATDSEGKKPGGPGSTEDGVSRVSEERILTRTPEYLFRANGSILKFPGFLSVYGRSVGDADEAEESEKRLPNLEKGEPLDLIQIIPEQHFTEPPSRFTEATLIKALEQFGIGRPSTYAPILSNIQERGYIEQIENRRLRPTELGFTVNDLLVNHFADIVDVGFTAKMEEKLDEIAEGKEEWVRVLSGFYTPFEQTLKRAAAEMPEVKLEDEKTDITCEVCGSPMVIRRGKFGKFIACSSFPKCSNTRSLTTGITCPDCKRGELAKKRTRRGRSFYGCSRYPECKFATWDRPLPDPCPTCGGVLVVNARGAARCLNRNHQQPSEAVRVANSH